MGNLSREAVKLEVVISDDLTMTERRAEELGCKAMWSHEKKPKILILGFFSYPLPCFNFYLLCPHHLQFKWAITTDSGYDEGREDYSHWETLSANDFHVSLGIIVIISTRDFQHSLPHCNCNKFRKKIYLMWYKGLKILYGLETLN